MIGANPVTFPEHLLQGAQLTDLESTLITYRLPISYLIDRQVRVVFE